MNQTVWPLAVPLYSGRRTVSADRSTWRALSRTRLFRGRRPDSCPSPCAEPGLSSAFAGDDPPYQPIPTRTTEMVRRIEASHLVLRRSFRPPISTSPLDIQPNKTRLFPSPH